MGGRKAPCRGEKASAGNVIKIRRGNHNQAQEQVIEKIARSFFVSKENQDLTGRWICVAKTLV
ncbi:hypothetical protein, partial [Paenibacillus dendritiformis]|uniref:hypothetical protein n=1 Tax=Paenibacillus dendritiformis TaxID=130049 RepID=UPI001C65C3E1